MICKHIPVTRAAAINKVVELYRQYRIRERRNQLYIDFIEDIKSFLNYYENLGSLDQLKDRLEAVAISASIVQCQACQNSVPETQTKDKYRTIRITSVKGPPLTVLEFTDGLAMVIDEDIEEEDMRKWFDDLEKQKLY